MAPLTLICAVMTYAWPFARSQGSLIAIAVLYGYVIQFHCAPSSQPPPRCRTYIFVSVPSGAYVSNFLIPLYEMGEVEDIGRRTGMAMTFAACGALAGPPISGAIYGQTGGYEAVGYYAGELALFGLVRMHVYATRAGCIPSRKARNANDPYRQHDCGRGLHDAPRALHGPEEVLGQVLEWKMGGRLMGDLVDRALTRMRIGRPN